jgi:hypothetical protein
MKQKIPLPFLRGVHLKVTRKQCINLTHGYITLYLVFFTFLSLKEISYLYITLLLKEDYLLSHYR